MIKKFHIAAALFAAGAAQADSNVIGIDLVHDPLLTMLVVAACMPVFSAQKGSANTAVDAVVLGGVREADQVLAGLG